MYASTVRNEFIEDNDNEYLNFVTAEKMRIIYGHIVSAPILEMEPIKGGYRI